MTLGNKIKKRREELGLSQTELAEMTNISQPGISRLENGQCSIEAGITLLDLLTNFERIASHCENIALHITKRVNKELHLDDMHGHMMDKHSEEYKGLYLYYKSQYVDKIENE